MSFVNGLNLLPSTGEFAYGTIARQGRRFIEPVAVGINFYQGGTPAKTDLDFSLDQLQAAFPDCRTVAVICSWFGSAIDASTCKIYPSTTYIGGTFQKWNGSIWVAENWQCSSLVQGSFGLIPISQTGDRFNYGGTPSDQSIVECIADLKARGFRVVFYPFVLMDDLGKSWRGRISYSPDVSSTAASAVSSFLGSAVPANFTRLSDTVSYSGSSTDFTYRRMILHYANLCVVAGGVDLFLIGSEFRGLETIRGAAWTNAGTTDGGGNAIWDYPFIDGLIQLSDDVRSIFDGAGFTKDLSGLRNLVSYAADWSAWMGFSHAASTPASPNGQWPHLDKLWSHANIDLVCFDNYLPITDWTTGTGGVDVLNWSAAAAKDEFLDYGLASDAVLSAPDWGFASDTAPVSKRDYALASAAPAWPPAPAAMSGLGLEDTPTLLSKDYLKANIEGGERFNWFYFDSNNLGVGLDPNGSGLQVSRPEGDRLAQSRNQFFPQQEILCHKQLRWWWNNPHRALYDNGVGGEIPHGPATGWVPQSKSIVFTEYGFPASDKSTNQPNRFVDISSSEAGTAYWSIWDSAAGGKLAPRQDQELQLLALQAFYEYWFADGHNAKSPSGLDMIAPAFSSVWNWDARPFPAFPNRRDVWGDSGNWQAGNWLNGKGPFLVPPIGDPPFVPAPYPAFPVLAGRAWSVHYKPLFTNDVAEHVSGRESRSNNTADAILEIELTFDILQMDGPQDLQALAGFYDQVKGQDLPFVFAVPPEIGFGASVNCRFADDSEDLEEFMARLWELQSLKLRSVKE